MNFSLPTKHNIMYTIHTSEATEQYINVLVYQISSTCGITYQIITTVFYISAMRCICFIPRDRNGGFWDRSDISVVSTWSHLPQRLLTDWYTVQGAHCYIHWIHQMYSPTTIMIVTQIITANRRVVSSGWKRRQLTILQTKSLLR